MKFIRYLDAERTLVCWLNVSQCNGKLIIKLVIDKPDLYKLRVLKGYQLLICLLFGKDTTKTIVLFSDNIFLIQMYQNVFPTCMYAICELLIHCFT